MQSGADITGRLLRAAVRRRAPLWLAVVLPWALLLSAAGVAVTLLWAAWDFQQLRSRINREWPRWLDGSVRALEDSSALLVHAETPVAKLQRNRLIDRVSAVLSDDIVGRIAAQRVRSGCGLTSAGWQGALWRQWHGGAGIMRRQIRSRRLSRQRLQLPTPAAWW
jgi:hypothetical protein